MKNTCDFAGRTTLSAIFQLRHDLLGLYRLTAVGVLEGGNLGLVILLEKLIAGTIYADKEHCSG